VSCQVAPGREHRNTQRWCPDTNRFNGKPRQHDAKGQVPIGVRVAWVGQLGRPASSREPQKCCAGRRTPPTWPYRLDCATTRLDQFRGDTRTRVRSCTTYSTRDIKVCLVDSRCRASQVTIGMDSLIDIASLTSLA